MVLRTSALTALVWCVAPDTGLAQSRLGMSELVRAKSMLDLHREQLSAEQYALLCSRLAQTEQVYIALTTLTGASAEAARVVTESGAVGTAGARALLGGVAEVLPLLLFVWPSTAHAPEVKPELRAARLKLEQQVEDLTQAVRQVEKEILVRSVQLDPAAQARADQALAECADLASKEVLARRMKGRNPTPRECLERVGQDAKGQPITRAMQLGDEMHQVALKCAREKLSKPPAFDFSIEQRYRYDPQTGRTVPFSPELEQALLRQGLATELLGTIVPDVVLHTGNPARIQDVYDFKFPCVNTQERPLWRKYPDGHPYQDQSQGEIYLKALGVPPARVAPRLGVIR